MTRATKRSDAMALSGVRSEKGLVDRPVSGTYLVVPAGVQIEGDRLIWTHVLDPWSDAETRARIVNPGPKLLDEFIGLSHSGNDEVVRFAMKWGVLGICEHGLPHTHSQNVHDFLDKQSYCELRLLPSPDAFVRRGWEPLASWMYYSKQAQMMLRTAAWLHQGKVVEDCEAARSLGLPSLKERPFRERARAQMNRLKSEVNHWLLIGAVRPILCVDDKMTFRIELGTKADSWNNQDAKTLLPYSGEWQGTTLFGALGVQLMMAISRSEGLAFCSGCQRSYSPSRKINTARHNYCPSCRTAGIPSTIASRRYRKTLKAKASQQEP
jgi:hypothetical protein